jgi:hypothetical protein
LFVIWCLGFGASGFAMPYALCAMLFILTGTSSR